MTIDMTRHQGGKNLPVVECTDTRLQTYRVRTDMQTDTDPETGEERGVTFIETEFPYKPTLAEKKDEQARKARRERERQQEELSRKRDEMYRNSVSREDARNSEEYWKAMRET